MWLQALHSVLCVFSTLQVWERQSIALWPLFMICLRHNDRLCRWVCVWLNVWQVHWCLCQWRSSSCSCWGRSFYCLDEALLYHCRWVWDVWTKYKHSMKWSESHMDEIKCRRNHVGWRQYHGFPRNGKNSVELLVALFYLLGALTEELIMP